MLHASYLGGQALAISAQVPFWNWRNPVSQGNDFRAVTYGGGRFVAVGEGGAVVTSTDGQNWIQAFANTRLRVQDVAFGGGR